MGLVNAGASCPRCGEGHPDAARFCPRCGLDLMSANPPPTQHAAALVAGQLAGRSAAWPGAMPTAIGRRATGVGWIGVAVVTGSFLLAAMGLTAWAPSPRATPEARWDRMLITPNQVTDAEPFEIGAEVISTGPVATEPVWLVISWRPGDLAFDPDATGRFVGCVPAGCGHRDDPAAGTTTVSWPGLAAGERRALSVTVSVSGIESGGTFRYRVSSGVGPDERSLAGGGTWTLDPDVG